MLRTYRRAARWLRKAKSECQQGFFCSNPCTMSNQALKAIQKTRSVAMCDMFQSLQNIAKTVVLLHEEHFCDLCWLPPKKSKNVGLKAPKPALEPAKSSPERPKNRKKRPRWAKSAQKVHKKRPRAKKRRPRAKKVPTWLQHGKISAWILEHVAPPSISMQGGSKHISMQWGLTRLALQAAQQTWLQVGGPRPSQIEAETRKNRC